MHLSRLLRSDTLLRDGKILFVQAQPIPFLANHGPIEMNKAYNSLLTSIQILLDDIEFGRGDWMYLLRDEDGGERLVYKRKPLVISNFIWAPLIDETEIETTRWGIYGTREGRSTSTKLVIYLAILMLLPQQVGGKERKWICTSPHCPRGHHLWSGKMKGI